MAKIDTSRIAGYADMSLEDKLKALEAFEYNDNASELEKQKAAVSKANSEAASRDSVSIRRLVVVDNVNPPPNSINSRSQAWLRDMARR